MPTRSIPRSDDNRSNALGTCALKAQHTLPAQWLITTTLNNDLNAILSPWRNARIAAATALQNQTNATAAANSAWVACARIISHYIQVLNLAIERGVVPASVRAFYTLPVSHAEVPAINTTADALLWVEKLEAGEASRVAAGGPAMAWPTIAQVSAAGALCASTDATQTTAKSAYDALQEAIADMRPAVDTLIKNLWDTIEFNLRDEDLPSLRRKAREWGVIYTNDATTAPTALGIDSLTALSPTSVKVTYATTGGEDADTETLQFKLPGDADFGHDTPLVRPEQIITDPAFAGVTILFRTKLTNPIGTTFGTPASITL